MKVTIDSRNIGTLSFLCDTGSALCCIQAALVDIDRVDILPTEVQPIGVSGQPLETAGDVIATIHFDNNQQCSQRFTLIVGLPYQGIIGISLLEKKGFGLSSNGKTVILNNTKITRVSEKNYLNHIHTPTTIAAIETKILCKTKQSIGEVTDRDHTKKETNLVPAVENEATAEFSITQNHEGQIPREISFAKTDMEQEVSGSADGLAELLKLRACSPKVNTLRQTTVESSINDSRISINNDGFQPDTSNNEHYHMYDDEVFRKLIQNTDLEKDHQCDEFKELINKYKDTFSKHDDDMGCFNATDGGPSEVTFEVKDPTVFCYAVPRRVPYARREWLQNKLQSWCELGIVTKVPYSIKNIQVSPVVIVPKKNNRYRMAVDYREINKNLQPESHPLPNVRNCIEELANKRYFTALDVTAAFQQVKVSEETKLLLGFVTLGNRYVTNRMPYGAHPCPGAFQLIIQRALRLVPGHCCTLYLDDILIHSLTAEEHMVHLRLVLHELARHGLKLSPKKCNFFQKSIEYLGFIIGEHNGKYGYTPIPTKIQALKEFKEPTTPKEVRQFCGCLQYYNQLIPNLNIKLSPLHRGAAKKPFVMTDEMKLAFNEVKALLSKRILLSFPDFSLTFKLSTDASFAGASGILTQIHPDGHEEIIFLFSKSFDDVQTRWTILELECLALVWSLDKMRILLLGRRFIWLTDSLVLAQLINKPPRDLSRSARKISRYIDYINTFEMEIRHEKGTHEETQFADMLSRSPICGIESFFRLQITKKDWENAVKMDKALQSATEEWWPYKEKLFCEEGIVYVNKKPRCQIAVPKELQVQLLQYYHIQFTIHAGAARMISLITPIYFWPNIYKAIREYVRNCEMCIKSKPMPVQSGVKVATPTPTIPFEWIQIDLVTIGNKQSSMGFRYVLTTICCLTNYLQMVPIATKEAVVIIKALGLVFCNSGVPTIIQSDNAAEFRAKVVQTHAQFLNINWRFSTPYKPSTNGRIERKHMELGKLLKLRNCNHTNWHEEIPFIQFEINSTVDKVTGVSAFDNYHGWSPRVPHFLNEIDPASLGTHFYEWSGQPDKMEWEERLRERQRNSFIAIHQQRQAYKDQEALTTNLNSQLVPGDVVLVKLPGSGKLTAKKHGPYTVVRVFPGGSFTAKEQNGNKTVRLPADHAVRIKQTKVITNEIINPPIQKDITIPRRTAREKPDIDYSAFY